MYKDSKNHRFLLKTVVFLELLGRFELPTSSLPSDFCRFL